MPAHARLAHLAEVGELGDAHLGRARQPLDDEQPGGVGESLEVDREVTRADGDAPRESPPRWPRRGVRTHKGIFHKGSLMNVRPIGAERNRKSACRVSALPTALRAGCVSRSGRRASPRRRHALPSGCSASFPVRTLVGRQDRCEQPQDHHADEDHDHEGDNGQRDAADGPMPRIIGASIREGWQARLRSIRWPSSRVRRAPRLADDSARQGSCSVRGDRSRSCFRSSRSPRSPA